MGNFDVMSVGPMNHTRYLRQYQATFYLSIGKGYYLVAQLMFFASTPIPPVLPTALWPHQLSILQGVGLPFEQ